jgi:hypothetical protein
LFGNSSFVTHLETAQNVIWVGNVLLGCPNLLYITERLIYPIDSAFDALDGKYVGSNYLILVDVVPPTALFWLCMSIL